MNETPKCPGCGSEMKAVDFGREHLNFSFFCYECGWGSPLCDTAEEALSAALRRAEPEMRPLTLDEILAKANEEDWNFVWLEHKKFRTPPCNYAHGIDKEIKLSSVSRYSMRK